MFETLVDGQYANPVMVVDEIDKAARRACLRPARRALRLLEHDTAGAFIDEFAEVPIDASQVIWIATANDERAIPEPILNRMNVYEVQAPDHEAARAHRARLYAEIRADHDWGQRFEPEPRADVLDRLAELAPRDMRRALMTGFGNARLAGGGRRSRPTTCPAGNARRAKIGFTH